MFVKAPRSAKPINSFQKCQRASLWLAALVVTFWTSSASLAGSPFKTLPDLFDADWRPHQIAPATYMSGSGLSLSHADRHDLIKRHLYKRGLHHLLNVYAKPSDFDSQSLGRLSSNLGLIVREYTVKAGSFDVCKSTFRTVDAPNGASHVLGLLPNVEAVYPTAEDSWMPLEDATDFAFNGFIQAGIDTSETSISSVARCLYPTSGELVPAWKIIMRAGHLPYLFYVGDGGVIEANPMGFHAVETVKAHRFNSRDPIASKRELIDFSIDVKGDGFLTNDYFTTGFGDSTPRSTFPFTATSGKKFEEQSTFAHVNRQFEFVSQHGYVWKGPKPLRVLTSFTDAGDGNAQYVPFDGRSGPFIVIGPQTNPNGLKNLATDSDVISHEFGHHVVYGSVTDIPPRSESLMIHEGLSDALTFYASGDNCLAESICPIPTDPEGWCQVEGRCLRTADQDYSLKYNGEVYNANPKAHIRGQLISALFADLKRGGEIPSDSLNKLLVASIAYLPREASVRALIIAMLDADFALFNQRYSIVIKRAADARSMGVDDLALNLNDVDGKAPVAQTQTSKKKKDDGFLGLCSIGEVQQSTSSAIIIVLLMLIPLVVSASKRSQPVLVKIKKTKK